MERLTPLDVSNLRIEDRGLPMHVAALAILDGAGLSGPLGLDALRETVRQRLHLAPRLRQVLYRPRLGLGPPIWVDDPAFDIRLHVRACEVPSPGDEPHLLALCSELNETRLDRSRPLWELWLLTGLSQGRAAGRSQPQVRRPVLARRPRRHRHARPPAGIHSQATRS